MGELAVFRKLSSDVDKFVFLRKLREKDEVGFFRLLMTHTDELLPVVYTPTVGEVCQRYHDLDIRPVGLYITPDDHGRIEQKLRAAAEDVWVCVVTDGERILGLGDLGAGGIGISEGKILLFTALGGVPPSKCLPVCLDVGTNNQELLDDPGYKGLRRRRLRGPTYFALVDEFCDAMAAVFPRSVIQFEDFGNQTAFTVLETHRGSKRCFNDDIQGTACVALAGILSATRCTDQSLRDQRFLFHGAGEAGTGIGELISLALHLRHGIPLEQARKSCFFMDSKGLVCASRTDLQHHKRPFAHQVPAVSDLESAIRALKPTALIGVSTQAGAFSPRILSLMAEINDRPIIFALSNPTSKSECTAEEAYVHTDWRVLFASGSPFDPVIDPRGRTIRPSQANNAYVFPAIGYGSVLAQATHIPDDSFLVAAEALASLVTDAELEEGGLFPSFTNVSNVSADIAAAVAEHSVASGYGQVPVGGLPRGGWPMYVRASMYHPPPVHSARL